MSDPVTTIRYSDTSHAKRGAYLNSTFIANRRSCWTPINNRLFFIGCGDDRAPTDESASTLIEQTTDRRQHIDPRSGYASIYGGVLGQAKNALVVGVAQFGESFIDRVGGFHGIMDLLIRYSHNHQTVHSASANEQDYQRLSMQSSSPVGCAYAAGIGLTAELLVDPAHTLIREVAEIDLDYIFGSHDTLAGLLRGQQAFLDHTRMPDGQPFTFTRSQYADYAKKYSPNLAIMILDGQHAAARTSGVISNFYLDRIGSSYTAQQQQLGFYRLDIAVIADDLLQALSRPLLQLDSSYTLSPDLLLAAFQLDATPVRAVLCANDQHPKLHNKLDPRGLAVGSYGNPFEAIASLKERQTNGYYLR